MDTGNILLQDQEVARSLISSDIMNTAIQTWLSMYRNSTDTTIKTDDGTVIDVPTLGLPAAVAKEIARLVTLELEFTVADIKEVNQKNVSEETRAQFLNRQIQPVIEQLKKYIEYAGAGGGIVFKPYIKGEKNIAVDVCMADEFIPLAFDDDTMTKCKFVEHIRVGSDWYHRFETHELLKDFYRVTNEAYVSKQRDSKGRRCSLSAVNAWSSLEKEVIIKNTSIPLFVYLPIPGGNSIDQKSPLGISVYANGVPQIKEADRQWDRYLWEFVAGEMMVEASKSAFERDENGTPIIPKGKERLFWATQFDSKDDNDTLTKFHAPEFREIALKAGLNTILQRVEFNCGLAYGTLSDPSAIEKTATEIISSKQRSYSTINDIQTATDKALKKLVDVIDKYTDLYELAPAGEYQIKSSWDDSIIIDANAERARDLNEVRMGLMQKWEYRVKWYGEDEETAKARTATHDSKGSPFET